MTVYYIFDKFRFQSLPGIWFKITWSEPLLCHEIDLKHLVRDCRSCDFVL